MIMSDDPGNTYILSANIYTPFYAVAVGYIIRKQPNVASLQMQLLYRRTMFWQWERILSAISPFNHKLLEAAAGERQEANNANPNRLHSKTNS